MNSPSFFRQQSTLICFGKKTRDLLLSSITSLYHHLPKLLEKKWHLFMGLYVFGGRGRWRGRGCIRLVHCWHSLGRPVTIGTPMVIFVPKVYQQCTNRQKQAKTAKRQSNSKNDRCTNRHMSTQSPPNTRSPRPPNTQSLSWLTLTA